MHFVPTDIDGVVVVELEPHVDDRGLFARTYCEDEFGAAGLPTRFPQCNLSVNDRAGTLRGMHFNVAPYGESKLVRCVRGAIHDVVVDLRPGSPTRLEHVAIELSADNQLALFVPEGCAHGFLTLADRTDVYYHMGSAYVPSAARGMRWNDPLLSIDWPIEPTAMSAADAAYPDLDPTRPDLLGDSA
jgi:dTDP-4-dehydrorhamnose 3,5-epimerase